MKTSQFCSVCKEWLDMEVVPTGDGDEDDGVVWFRCPQCQGFLPKLKSAPDEAAAAVEEQAEAADPPESAATPETGEGSPDGEPSAAPAVDPAWDSPADMMAAQALAAGESGTQAATDADAGPGSEEAAPAAEDAGDAASGAAPDGELAESPEPVAEYAAMLEEVDTGAAVPYRPWETYEVGQCIVHLAWDDCGVVVGKEALPGGRRAVKCYFAEAGIVRLIENAPRP